MDEIAWRDDVLGRRSPAGNLIFDGTRYFTYDDRNRLVKVQASFSEASVNAGNFITDGQPFQMCA